MKKYIKMPMQMYAGSTATNPAVLESGTTTAAAELKSVAPPAKIGLISGLGS